MYNRGVGLHTHKERQAKMDALAQLIPLLRERDRVRLEATVLYRVISYLPRARQEKMKDFIAEQAELSRLETHTQTLATRGE
jgi:hypothetical protein